MVYGPLSVRCTLPHSLHFLRAFLLLFLSSAPTHFDSTGCEYDLRAQATFHMFLTILWLIFFYLNKRLPPFVVSSRLAYATDSRYTVLLSTIIATITLSFRFSTTILCAVVCVRARTLRCVFVHLACDRVCVRKLLGIFDRLARLHKYQREWTVMVSTEFSFHVTSSSPHECFFVMPLSSPLLTCDDGQSGSGVEFRS